MLGKKVLFQNFELKSVEIKGAVVVEFQTLIDSDGMDIYINQTVECPLDPHHHLTEIFERAKIHLIRSYGMESLLLALQKKHKFEISDSIKGIKSLVTVSKIHLKGKEDNRGVIFSGKCDSIGKKAVAMNSPLIFLNTSTYGYEQDLEILCSDLKEQVFAYLYEGKFTKVFETEGISGTGVDQKGNLV